MRRVAEGEPSLDAGVSMVGVTVLVGNHAHDLGAFHLHFERASDAAVRARCHHRVIWLTQLDDRLLHERP